MTTTRILKKNSHYFKIKELKLEIRHRSYFKIPFPGDISAGYVEANFKITHFAHKLITVIITII